MLRKFLLAAATALVAFFVATGFAFAAVDVNNADQAQLESIKGIGPAISAKILEERKKGNFKDWKDLEDRVKGVGDKNSVKFSQAGLTVSGQAKANAPAMADTKAAASKTTKTTKKSDAMTPAAKTDAMADTKTTATTSKKGAAADAPMKADAKAGAMADTKTTTKTKKDESKSEMKKDDTMKK